MCEYSGKLIAFLDHELPVAEAIEVELHLEDCAGCRARLAEFTSVTREFDAYCNETMEIHARRRTPNWTPAGMAVGIAAAVAALFFVWPRTRVAPRATHAPETVVAAAPILAAKAATKTAAPVETIRRRPPVAPGKSLRHAPGSDFVPAQIQADFAPADEPMIQIAIPGDEMFPPGAVPAGVNFTADLAIAADGTAEIVRLRPRFAGFERRTTAP